MVNIQLSIEDHDNLRNSRVVVVGVGTIGSRSAEALTKLGIGEIVLIDRDIVEEDNLDKQLLYNKTDVNQPKAIVSANTLNVNPDIKFENYVTDLNKDNVNLLKSDLVLDCTDNFETRFLINDFCKKNNIPWIFSSASGKNGFVYTTKKNNPCFSCIFKESKELLENCDNDNILNKTADEISSLQVEEAVKSLIGRENTEELMYLAGKITKIKVKKLDSCKACNGEFKYLDKQIEMLIKKCKLGGAYEAYPQEKIDLNNVKDNFEIITLLPVLAVIKFENKIITIYKHGKIIIKDCETEEEARKITEGVILKLK